jgi:hypothetical protein
MYLKRNELVWIIETVTIHATISVTQFTHSNLTSMDLHTPEPSEHGVATGMGRMET